MSEPTNAYAPPGDPAHAPHEPPPGATRYRLDLVAIDRTLRRAAIRAMIIVSAIVCGLMLASWLLDPSRFEIRWIYQSPLVILSFAAVVVWMRSRRVRSRCATYFLDLDASMIARGSEHIAYEALLRSDVTMIAECNDGLHLSDALGRDIHIPITLLAYEAVREQLDGWCSITSMVKESPPPISARFRVFAAVFFASGILACATPVPWNALALIPVLAIGVFALLRIRRNQGGNAVAQRKATISIALVMLVPIVVVCVRSL